MQKADRKERMTAMDSKGKIVVRYPAASVHEVFNLTGFSNLFRIE